MELLIGFRVGQVLRRKQTFIKAIHSIRCKAPPTGLCFAAMKHCNYNIIIIFLASLAACNGKPMNKGVFKSDPTRFKGNKTLTGVDIKPGIETVDSLQVVYYDNPGGDALRYTRFFRFVNTTDPSFVSALKKDLKQPFNKKTYMINCRSEGKIYLYLGQAIIKTVFFSTRSKSCCHLFFISDGSFMYFDISGAFSERLKMLREKAVMP